MAVSLGFLPTQGDAHGPASTLALRRRAPVTVLSWLALLTAVLLPFAGHQLQSRAGFRPAVLALVVCLGLLSLVALLVGAYLDEGDPRLLATAVAFLWSCVVAATRMAEPTPYLLVLWQAGFALLLGLAWAPWPPRWEQPTDQARRPAALLWCAAAAVVVGGLGVGAVLALVQSAPGLVHATGLPMATAPVALVAAVIGAVLSWRAVLVRSGAERWVPVAAGTCLLGLVLSYAGSTAFTAGRYAGAAATVPAAGVLLVAVLAGFRQTRADAEFLADHDALTGLANRRSAVSHLDMLVARAARSASPLSVVLIELARAGENIDGRLVEAAAQLSRAVRAGDLVSRYDDAVLLVLLPDTDESGAAAVVQKLRGLLDLDATSAVATASVRPDDEAGGTLLGRAEHALYRARFSSGGVPAAG